ncbi:excinuclease ABC, B subunit [Hoylesella saccharolytica F0055]|uniref:UvrABC system protein B n=1 Tax=Hoylesella saccharolytica F0055 TaxID=1127699 RepID=L1NKV4_9BACT|nr:excinuclease ABC subunit UvrB [Hoylesella saccharolytica]EKY03890.1 excinuclease ABC, B subunit [Hoylesella saccharolytica F0055]
MDFKLISKYQPTGDQPEAIRQLTAGLERGDQSQVLLGVTGSGKTFTMANVIVNANKPTLILSHNKTLAAQLYEEMKSFFPENAVEYYVSYYDYYQPEAYLPTSDTYIEKDLAINEEIDKLRLSTVSALLSGRKDVVVISSVSCIYGMGGPTAMENSIISINKGDIVDRNSFLRKLVDLLYVRNDVDLQRGTFRVKGDTVDIAMAYSDNILRLTWWDDELESIEEIDNIDYHRIEDFEKYNIYPANLFITTKEQTEHAIRAIQNDLVEQIDFFNKTGENIKAQRIKERVEYDIEMIKELGHCTGIENYSRYFDGREPGQRPYCLLDFFPKDYLIIVDESHVTIPQIGGMFGGDRVRKQNLVEFGFRLPAAFDNRPLRFEEFHSLIHQVIYVSATPADYELQEAEGVVVEQLIRPTGLLDPEIIVRPSENQIDDLLSEIITRADNNERVLVTTLTKRMAEELTEYLLEHNIRANYIHSDVTTLDRVRIMNALRMGEYDVLVGVNLLREGLDLPEVSLVAILDADKEGFLRNHRSLTQTAGRAARNVNGKVIMYADTITGSMQKTIDETARRRSIQIQYNEEHHIIPRQIVKEIKGALVNGTPVATDEKGYGNLSKAYLEADTIAFAADPIIEPMTRPQLEKSIENTTALMKKAAKELDFIQAAQYRDEIARLQKLLEMK